ncbi:DUF6468 domain-containing protein [Asaia astilbis]|uniref:DUF6468 domain-containing protein n=1 Tax=Asaia astilbis TaxID=610244 RepID=UPI00047204EE|nr:DUF6468 domain-containing protein [Asaia astilbis]
MLAQVQIFIEIALSVLLLLGIAYNFYISKTLSALKADRANLIKLIEKLETSIKNAHDGVERLRVAGQVSGRPLSRTIEQAKIVGTELDTLVDRADSKAEKLTELTSKAATREQALGKLLDDASDLKLDMLRKIETPLVPDSDETEQEAIQSKPAEPTKSAPSSKTAPEPKRTPPPAPKNTPTKTVKQRFENTFLGGPKT